MAIGQPLANYAAYRKAGDTLYMSGVIAVDPAAQTVIECYAQLPATALASLGRLGYVTGQMSVDLFEAPIVAQSWFVLNRIQTMVEECGGEMKDVVKLVQYFRNLAHYPAYNRVRGLFFDDPVVSTVVEVSGMLPNVAVLLEVEATVWLPQR